MSSRAIIGVAHWHRTKADLRRLARALDAGKRTPRADFELNFADAAELVGEMSRERLRLLGALHALGASSIYSLARKLGRNYANVHADVRRLEALGLIERDAGKRIIAPWSEIRITLPLEANAA